MAAVIEGPYLLDLLDQPAALGRAASGLAVDSGLLGLARHLRAGDYRRIVLTGMGSSLYSLYPLHLRLTAQGHFSYWVETAELLHYQPEALRGALIIVVSQSGLSAEIVALAEAVRGQAALLALTNNLESPLAKAADVVLPMHAGSEATVACKTFSNSLLVLEWLAAVLLGEDADAVQARLSKAPDAAAGYLANWREHVAYLIASLQPVKRIFVTGRGPSLATALDGGLILKESMHFNAEGMSCAAFRHGPFESLNPNVLVLVMGGDTRTAAMNRRMIDDVRATGGCAEIIDTVDTAAPFTLPSTDECLRRVMEMLPVQMITLALGALAGREAGKFEIATKITTVE